MTIALQLAGSVFREMLAGQLSVGLWLSLTVTVKLHELPLPAASVTEQVTVVAPFAKAEPDEGLQVTVPTPAQLSLATGVE